MNLAKKKERKVHIEKKGRVYEIQDKGKVDIIDLWEQKNTFQRSKLVQRLSFHSICETWIA